MASSSSSASSAKTAPDLSQVPATLIPNPDLSNIPVARTRVIEFGKGAKNATNALDTSFNGPWGQRWTVA